MGINGIDHWVIVAADPERTLAFYAALGLSIAWEARPNRPGRGMPTIRVGTDQKINVHGPDWPGRPGYLGARRPAAGAADFCLEWEGTVEQILNLLARNGIPVEAGPGPRTCARGLSTSVYFRDPDENLVELTVYERTT
jgi:catechol 2,3-dioxygenase-like lactoylglutathione lyase family enzyme